MNHSYPSSIEILESRIAPAGIVTAMFDLATGTLTLGVVGVDTGASVFKTGTDTYRVEADPSTSINTNGNPFADIAGKLAHVVINGGAGADSFSLTNLLTLTDLTFNGGAGSDSLSTFNLTTKAGVIVNLEGDGGGVTFGGVTTIGGGLTVNYGDNGGGATITGTVATIKGAITLNGGAGADNFELSADTSTVAKGIKFAAGAGANQAAISGFSATIGKGATGNAIEFTGGDNGNSLEFLGTTLSAKGKVVVTTGAGIDTVNLHPAFLKIGDALTVSSGGAADSIEVSPGVGTIKGAVNFTLGDGDGNAVEFGPLVSLALGSSLTVTGGTQSDSFQNSGGALFSVKGPALFDLGDGSSNSVDLNATQVVLGSSLTIKSATTGAVSASSNGTFLTVKGLVDVESGDAASSVQFSAIQTSLGALTVNTGAAADIVGLDGAKLTVAGAVIINTGAEQDSVDFNFHAIDLKKGVSINTGANADIINFFADGTVKGDFLIDLGTGTDGSSFLDIAGDQSSGIAGNLKIGGKLTVTAATTGAGNLDFIGIKQVTVTKATSITLGDADGLVTINNLFAKDTFTLNTGGGQDDVEIEQDTLFGPSVFSKAVTIDLGAGDDTFRLGISSAAGSSSFAKFYGPLSVDGGANTDGSNDFLNTATNFFAPGVLTNPLTVRSNFEGAFL